MSSPSCFGRPYFAQTSRYAFTTSSRIFSPLRVTGLPCSLRHGGSLVPARWTGWSWQTRFSGLPGSRRYSVVKFNSDRDISAGCASNGWNQRCGRTRLPRLRAPAVHRLRDRATRPLLLQGPGLLPELRWTAHDGVAPPALSTRCCRGPRAPVGAESSVASSLSAGVGPRAGARGARRVRAGAAGLPAPPRAPVRATPISWMPAGAEARRLSRVATRSDPT
jgi:hypothetical protein